MILLGPVRTGKSTLAPLLAAQFGIPHVSLDDLRWHYYQEIGYNQDLAHEIRQRGGMLALAVYWQLFDAYSVERVVADHPDAVIDFGAGIGVAESHEQFARVQQALAPFPNILLILPSADVDESLQILHVRDQEPPDDLNFDFNAHFLRHHGYYDLAKFTIYTKGKRPQDTCDEIVRVVVSADHRLSA
jgi:hypothetical protein